MTRPLSGLDVMSIAAHYGDYTSHEGGRGSVSWDRALSEERYTLKVGNRGGRRIALEQLASPKTRLISSEEVLHLPTQAI